ncbi:MAG: hypothetical protein ACYTAF_07560 [Planctomycetota bacterium]|jgi:hypothetical protein
MRSILDRPERRPPSFRWLFSLIKILFVVGVLFFVAWITFTQSGRTFIKSIPGALGLASDEERSEAVAILMEQVPAVARLNERGRLASVSFDEEMLDETTILVTVHFPEGPDFFHAVFQVDLLGHDVAALDAKAEELMNR